MKPLLLLALVGLLAAPPTPAQTPPITISPAQTQELLARPGTVLLDVRTPTEFGAGHLRGARNVNFLSTDFAGQVAKLDPAATYVLYCKVGTRSAQAETLMREKGFRLVYNAGSFEALKAAGLPTE